MKKEKFARSLSYRAYRLKNRSKVCSERDTAKVRDHNARLEMTMSKWKISGMNHMAIQGFLAKFVKEADILGMSQAQSLLGVSCVMSGAAQTTFEAVRDSPLEGRHGVTTWPEEINYLLAHYCT